MNRFALLSGDDDDCGSVTDSSAEEGQNRRKRRRKPKTLKHEKDKEIITLTHKVEQLEHKRDENKQNGQAFISMMKENSELTKKVEVTEDGLKRSEEARKAIELKLDFVVAANKAKVHKLNQEIKVMAKSLKDKDDEHIRTKQLLEKLTQQAVASVARMRLVKSTLNLCPSEPSGNNLIHNDHRVDDDKTATLLPKKLNVT